jgi:hypothetical protein
MYVTWYELNTTNRTLIQPEGAIVIDSVDVSQSRGNTEVQVLWKRAPGYYDRAGGTAEIPGTALHALRVLEREISKPGSLDRPLVNACLDKLWDTVLLGEGR